MTVASTLVCGTCDRANKAATLTIAITFLDEKKEMPPETKLSLLWLTKLEGSTATVTLSESAAADSADAATVWSKSKDASSSALPLECNGKLFRWNDGLSTNVRVCAMLCGATTKPRTSNASFRVSVASEMHKRRPTISYLIGCLCGYLIISPREGQPDVLKISVILWTHDCVVSKLNNGVSWLFYAANQLRSLMEGGSVRRFHWFGSPVRRFSPWRAAQAHINLQSKSNR